MEKQEIDGIFENLSKKEYTKKRKEMDKLRRLFNGIKEMKSLPDVVIFTNQCLVFIYFLVELIIFFHFFPK